MITCPKSQPRLNMVTRSEETKAELVLNVPWLLTRKYLRSPPPPSSWYQSDDFYVAVRTEVSDKRYSWAELRLTFTPFLNRFLRCWDALKAWIYDTFNIIFASFLRLPIPSLFKLFDWFLWKQLERTAAFTQTLRLISTAKLIRCRGSSQRRTG
jgi:hypothetical protein